MFTPQDVVVSFPLYTEAIRFAFHEEGMVRTAVRAVTLNVYHGKLLYHPYSLLYHPYSLLHFMSALCYYLTMLHL